MLAEAQAKAEAQKNPFGYLVNLEGKDPVRDNLWSDANIMDSMERTLGKQRTKLLISGWGKGDPVATQISRVDDNMVFAACKPHDQCYHQAIIFISTVDGSVNACWQDANGKAVTDFWLGADGSTRKLPGGTCEMKEQTNLSQMFRQNSANRKNR